MDLSNSMIIKFRPQSINLVDGPIEFENCKLD